jgi:sterol 3beta-glucosyltransferase
MLSQGNNYMNVLILAVGSQGDVQPFVALGAGLKQVGHTVRICTSKRFKPIITEHGLQFASIDDRLLQLAEMTEGRTALESGGNPLGLIRKVRPMIRRMLDDAWAAAPGADVIIYHPKALAGYHIAEKLQIPAFLSLFVPLYTPTSAFPNPLLPGVNFGGRFNKLTYTITPLLALPYFGVINAWRKQVLNLPPRSRLGSELVRANGQPMPVLYPYSEHVVSRPDDWPSTTVVTGYWFLDAQQDWKPPEELVEFLRTGSPPVYVGFGSMAGRDPARLSGIVLEALAQSGQRGLIATGWGGLTASDLPRSVFRIEAAPHDWLFPRCATVVHHGGAGTTAAGLRAGKPTLICPFFGDQPFWGRRVFELGVGPEPIPQKKLTADKMAAAIRQAVIDEGIRQRAGELGAKICVENGVARAVEFINDRI